MFGSGCGDQAETVLVVFNALFDACGLAIGNHEDLLVGILPAAEDIHGEFKTCYGIGVVGPHTCR